MAFTGLAIFRLRAGVIVEAWALADGVSVLRQLGVIRRPGPPGAPPPAT